MARLVDLILARTASGLPLGGNAVTNMKWRKVSPAFRRSVGRCTTLGDLNRQLGRVLPSGYSGECLKILHGRMAKWRTSEM
jgi:hypothetical protein